MNQGKKHQRFIYRGVVGLACIVVMIALGSSCNKDFPNKLSRDYKNDTLGIDYKERKVLYLIMDGINGEVLQKLETPNLTTIFRNAIYCYASLTDAEEITMTNANGWANMLTGVGVNQHGVKTEDFSNHKLQTYQSIFSRLKTLNPKMRTVSLASSGIFNSNLAPDATVKNTFENDDAAVYGNLITELKTNDAGFVLAQFHSAELAGRSSGYTVNSVEYAAAIQKLDAYVAEILKTLANRKNGKEDWLVVLASNKGGTTVTQPANAYGDVSRNNFIAFYNPKFSTQFIAKPDASQIPYVGVAANFTATSNTDRNGAVVTDPALYNFGLNGDFTFQLKVRIDHASGASAANIGGKREQYAPAYRGWVIYTSGNLWGLNMGNGSTQNTYTAGTTIVRDKIWHTLTFKIYTLSGKRWIKYFTDGVAGNTTDITTYYTNLDSPAPLSLGRIPYDANSVTDVLVKEIQMFNVALPDQVIIDNVRKVSIDSTHPNYNNLVGYWPVDEASGNRIIEKTGRGKDFVLTGQVKWKPFSDYSPFFDPKVNPAFYKIVPNSVDIPFQIYQWMGIKVPENWGLLGKSWKVLYSDTKL